METFTNASTFLKDMNEIEYMDAFKEFTESNFDALSRAASISVVIKSWKEIFNFAIKYTDAHNPVLVKELILVLSQFAVPQINTELYGEFLWHRTRTDILEMLQAPIAGNHITQ